MSEQERLADIKQWYPGASRDDLDWLIGQAERVERLERAVVLLANHCGGVGWNAELLAAIDAIRYPQQPPPAPEAAAR